MTPDEVRCKAQQMLAMRTSGSRLAMSDVILKNGTKFRGVLIELATRPGRENLPERLGFSLSDAKIQYVPIDSIREF